MQKQMMNPYTRCFRESPHPAETWNPSSSLCPKDGKLDMARRVGLRPIIAALSEARPHGRGGGQGVSDPG